jgi:hypothetical protein
MRIAGETHFTFASAKGAEKCERFVFFVSRRFSVGTYTAKKWLGVAAYNEKAKIAVAT